MYDLAVIGGGSAGLTAATIAGRLGARTILMDREALGGDCLWAGCVPSKALIHAARVVYLGRTGSRVGAPANLGAPDFPAALAYVRRAQAHIGAHDSPEALRAHGVAVAFGGARFLSPTQIRCGETVFEARRTIVAVGSHAVAPPIPGLAEAGHLDHVSIFALDHLPPRVAVIGGGPVGVELAQCLARFGAQVTILQRGPRLLPRDDAELSALLAQALGGELTVRCDAGVERVERVGPARRVHFSGGSLDCDAILVAVGRRARLDGLGLDSAGVAVRDGAVHVDPHLRTTAANIYACGDCVGGPQFTHFAEAQARVAVRNALFRGRQRFALDAVPWTTFTDPELAHVGAREGDVPGARVFRSPYERLDRAVCEDAPFGLGKVVCDARGRILGASLLGLGAGEALAPLVLARDAGLTLDAVGRSVFVYPTLGRVVRRLSDERFLAEGRPGWIRKLFGRF